MLKAQNAITTRFDVKKVIALGMATTVILSIALWLMLPKNISYAAEEEMKISDSIEAKITHPRTNTEALHVSDSIERQVHFKRTFIEELSISDSLGIPSFGWVN